jgi:hypothetical protein
MPESGLLWRSSGLNRENETYEDGENYSDELNTLYSSLEV